VQVPLPDHIDPKVIRRAVLPSKDVDGFHPLSNMLACTPKGIIDYLDANNFDFVGKHAVIIGRSFIVGRPLLTALLDRHCTVSMMHSKTSEQDALQLIASADLLVVAIGKKWYIYIYYYYYKFFNFLYISECRICLETYKNENTICPCNCSGSMKYVHYYCLDQWRAKSGRYKHCNVCKSLYNISKSDTKHAVTKTTIVTQSLTYRPDNMQSLVCNKVCCILYKKY
jgi:hypothetical protein